MSANDASEIGHCPSEFTVTRRLADAVATMQLRKLLEQQATKPSR